MGNNFTIFKHKWGTEKIVTNNKYYCVKDTTLNKYPGVGDTYCYHKYRDVVFYVVEGDLQLTSVYNGVVNSVELKNGESYRINPYIGYKFVALTKEARFMEVSNQYYQDDVFIVKFDDLPSPFKSN